MPANRHGELGLLKRFASALCLHSDLGDHNNLDEVLVTAELRENLAANITQMAPPTLATIAGGCLFAWMTWRWQSLWPAIALHSAVNFWWDIAPLAVLSPVASLMHGLALGIAAVVTWRFTPDRTLPSESRRKSSLTQVLQ